VDAEIIAIVVLVLMLAAANGANDISKGIATIMGSGVTDTRKALVWGTVCTLVGGAAAIVFGSALIQTFSSGYLAENFLVTREFLASTLIGAICWLVLSTLRGWPVSTTHALLGGLVGSVLSQAGPDGLKTAAVTEKALLPLLVSPLLAIVLCWLVLSGSKWLDHSITIQATRKNRRSHSGAADIFHWVSGGATSFARGLNDVPKIAAILVLAINLSSPGPGSLIPNGFVVPVILVTLTMALGGIWMGRRVLKTLAFQVVPLDPSTGVVANGATTALVLLASNFGLPVSTTHVSTGSLIGVRWSRNYRPCQKDSMVAILWAWVVTLPATAAVSAASFRVLAL
jgi:inorganic phosphate transporter, PiT family